ncbi:MAG: 50S ribosomal protein L2 [Candidatus Paceibacterota bacterium]
MKHYKPTTPSRRQMTTASTRGVLTASKPLKSLTKGKRGSSGRNAHGRITSRRRGGGHKRRHRDVDFVMEKVNIPMTVRTVEYDPNRSAYIGLVVYADGAKRYIVLPQSVSVGDQLLVSEQAPLKPGNRLPLKNIAIGTFVYNVELKPYGGSRIARSAGIHAEVAAKEEGFVHVKMPSSEVRRVPSGAWASIGEVSNEEHHLETIGKAGRARWMNRRPKVNGRSMNAVDHPMGGGEAHARGARKRRKSKWGKPVNVGQKTRTSKKYSDKNIVSRRKSKKR